MRILRTCLHLFSTTCWKKGSRKLHLWDLQVASLWKQKNWMKILLNISCDWKQLTQRISGAVLEELNVITYFNFQYFIIFLNMIVNTIPPVKNWIIKGKYILWF